MANVTPGPDKQSYLEIEATRATDLEPHMKHDDCKKEACPCPMMTKKRMKKSIERLHNLLKRVELLDDNAKASVMQNMETLMEKQESFLDQSINRLRKMTADYSYLNLEKFTGPGNMLTQAIDNLKKMMENWNPNLKKAKEHEAPSLKPPKGWWDEKYAEVKRDNPSYTEEQVRATVGSIWYDMSRGQRASRRHEEGKKYGKAPEA